MFDRSRLSASQDCCFQGIPFGTFWNHIMG
jgi:hypothetical protein